MLYVVTGPPAAGKTAWVTARAGARDIVIDLDRIALALAAPGAPAWQHDEVLLRVAHRARFAALDEAVKHRDAVDVYLIHTMPSPKARAKYQRLGAEIVTVDPGEDVVRERVAAMRSPATERVVTRWYRGHRRGGSRPLTTQASRDW